VSRIYQIRVAGPPPRPRGRTEESPLRFQATDGSYYLTAEELDQLGRRGGSWEALREVRAADLPVRFLRQEETGAGDPPESARLAVLSRLLAEGRAGGEVHVRFLGRNISPPPDGFVLDVAGGRRAYAWQVVPAAATSGGLPFAERFPGLRERFADSDTRVVLALGSGGVKLFCHAPALRLLELSGCAPHVDEVWGSSGGAMAGLLYCQGLSPQAIEELAYDLYDGRMSLVVRPSRLQLIRHLVRDTFLRAERAVHSGFVDCAQGMARMLDRYCADAEPQRPLYCIAFNLAECRAEVLTPEPVAGHLAGLATQTDAREAALASSTVPLLFVPRVIHRGTTQVHYIDGSTTEDVPLLSPVRKWDLDRAAGLETRRRLLIFYVKLTGNLARYRTHPDRVGKLRLLQAVVAASIEHMHRRDLELVRVRPDVEVIGLQLPDASSNFFDVACIPDYLRCANEAFPEQLGEIEAQLRPREKVA
jgi:hypothetical protein